MTWAPCPHGVRTRGKKHLLVQKLGKVADSFDRQNAGCSRGIADKMHFQAANCSQLVAESVANCLCKALHLLSNSGACGSKCSTRAPLPSQSVLQPYLPLVESNM